MKKKSALVINVEYAATVVAHAIIPILPRPAVLFLSRSLGSLAHHSSKKMRKIGLQNLDHVYADQKTLAEKEAILKKVFQNYALMGFDLFWFSKHTEKRMRKHMDIDEKVNTLAEPRPFMVLTGHLGNWELIGQAVNVFITPLHSIAAPLKNPKVDAFFVKLRELSGQKIIPQSGAMRQMMKVFKGNGNVALLLDQNTLPRDGGVFVNLFGLPVPVSSAPAAMLRIAQCDVAVGFCLPQEDGNYRAQVRKTLPPPSKRADAQELKEYVQMMTQEMEEVILERPDCWLWVYKRWKYIHEGSNPEDYPPYARPIKEREL